MLDHLDEILSRRAVPDVPPGLAERIIAAAALQPRRRAVFAVLDELRAAFSDFFVLPQPAFALSIVLLAGFVLGAVVNSQPSYASASITDEMFNAAGLTDANEEGEML